MKTKFLESKACRFIALLILGHLLSSCGFHLRGQGSNNIISGYEGAKIYFSAVEKKSPLNRRIKMDLQLSKFQLIDDSSLTNKHLIILSSEFQVRAIGTDRNGRDNEFEITQMVEFLVNQYNESDYKQLSKQYPEKLFAENDLEKSRVIARRSYYFDNNDPIGKKAEERVLRESMRIELSRKIISHLIVSLSQMKIAIEPIKAAE